MATQFEIDCALMAGRAYQLSRAELNWFPVPDGWAEFFHVPNDAYPTTDGFEAISFQRGTEIVISYAGTATFFGDWTDANVPLAFGFPSDQLRQAALYYLEVKASNATTNPDGSKSYPTISFTGHSLGGGLAALMGVFFDEKAVTFDQAPFANSASTGIRDDLVSYLNGQGYSDSQLATLVPELLSFNGYDDAYGVRGANVTGYYVKDEALQILQPTLSILGTQAMLDQNSVEVGAKSLHSQALLAAFLENAVFRAITFKLPELLKMVFDSALYYNDPNKLINPAVNFLELLIRHQTGVRDPETGITVIAADAMLDRFTADLQKVAQDGGFTLTNTHITNTLVAFAMQMYYENPEAMDSGKYLFTDVSGGIRFDRTDVAASLADAKGWQLYFQNYLAEDLTLEEPHRPATPARRHRLVHPGGQHQHERHRRRQRMEARSMKKRTTMKHWLLGVSLMILGGGMNACAMGDKTSWKEEVLLHDGKKLIVERSQTYGGRHEIGQKPPVKEQKLTFTLPGSNRSITWKSEYSEDVGRANLNLLALHVLNGTPYIVAEPNLCLAYNKWGRPNPPYVFFKYDGKAWKRIPLSGFPLEFKSINVVINTLEHADEMSRQGEASVAVVKEFNSSLLRYPSEHAQYKTILREPLKPGALGMGCPELVYYKGGWVSPGDSIGRRMMDRMSK